MKCFKRNKGDNSSDSKDSRAGKRKKSKKSKGEPQQSSSSSPERIQELVRYLTAESSEFNKEPYKEEPLPKEGNPPKDESPEQSQPPKKDRKAEKMEKGNAKRKKSAESKESKKSEKSPKSKKMKTSKAKKKSKKSKSEEPESSSASPDRFQQLLTYLTEEAALNELPVQEEQLPEKENLSTEESFPEKNHPPEEQLPPEELKTSQRKVSIKEVIPLQKELPPEKENAQKKGKPPKKSKTKQNKGKIICLAPWKPKQKQEPKAEESPKLEEANAQNLEPYAPLYFPSNVTEDTPLVSRVSFEGQPPLEGTPPQDDSLQKDGNLSSEQERPDEDVPSEKAITSEKEKAPSKEGKTKQNKGKKCPTLRKPKKKQTLKTEKSPKLENSEVQPSILPEPLYLPSNVTEDTPLVSKVPFEDQPPLESTPPQNDSLQKDGNLSGEQERPVKDEDVPSEKAITSEKEKAPSKEGKTKQNKGKKCSKLRKPKKKQTLKTEKSPELENSEAQPSVLPKPLYLPLNVIEETPVSVDDESSQNVENLSEEEKPTELPPEKDTPPEEYAQKEDEPPNEGENKSPDLQEPIQELQPNFAEETPVISEVPIKKDRPASEDSLLGDGSSPDDESLREKQQRQPKETKTQPKEAKKCPKLKRSKRSKPKPGKSPTADSPIDEGKSPEDKDTQPDKDKPPVPSEPLHEATPSMGSTFTEDKNVRFIHRIFYVPYDIVWRISVIIVGLYTTYINLFSYTIPQTELEQQHQEIFFCKYITFYFIEISLTVRLFFGRMHKPVALIMPACFLDAALTADLIYLVDGVLSLIAKRIRNLEVDPTIVVFPNWVLCTEIMSAISVDAIASKLHDDSMIKPMLYYLDLDLLKLVRVVYYLSDCRGQVGMNDNIIMIARYLFSLGMLIPLCFTLTSLAFCENGECPENVTAERLSFTVTTCTLNGFDVKAMQLKNINYAAMITILLAIVFLIWTASELSGTFINDETSFYLFIFKKESIIRICRRYSVPVKYRDICLNFFDIFWRTCKGYDIERPFDRILPFCAKQELALDISWPALKHSKLFRDMDLPFLRKTSLLMKQEFMVAGEYVYRKDMVKHRMIYIVSGIVEVLSQVDGETPILAFSSGTIIGETALFINYKSATSVRCKNLCEFHMLHKKDFCKIAKYFPKQFETLKDVVFMRYEKAQRLGKIFGEANKSRGITNIDQLTVTWMKNTLHKLMMKDGESSAEHECQNIFLREEFRQDKFENMLFTADYLELLAITGRIEMVDDSVFLKQSFPCVFQPNSVLLKIWNVIVCACVLCTGFVIPYVALVRSVTPEWFDTFHVLCSCVYFLDIVIQVSTAVRTSTRVLGDVQSIFVYRTGTMEFWLDIIAAYPLDMYACLFLTQISSQAHLCLLLNRILKMWKIKILILDGFGEGNSWKNVILKMHLKHACIIFYIIFLTSCVLYAQNCFDGECTAEVHGDSQFEKYLWFFFSAATIFEYAGITTPYSVYIDSFYWYSLLMVLSIIILIFTLSETISVYCLNFHPRILLEEAVTDVMSVVKAAGIGEVFVDRIVNFINAQWMFNRASNIVFGLLLMTTMPHSLYRRFREEMLLKIVSTMPIFVDLRSDLLSALCRQAMPLFIPPGEIIAYSGQVNDRFYCIVKGYCMVYVGSSSVKEKKLGPGACINVAEVCMRIPTVNTTKSGTHCELVYFDIKKLTGIFTKYPAELDTFKSVTAPNDVSERLVRLGIKATVFSSRVGQGGSKKINSSFHYFGYNLLPDSKEEYDYYVPFDQLEPFSWIAFFLMRVTILPHGKFMFRWEVFRCIFAFTSAMLFIVNPIYNSELHHFKYTLIFLDLTSIVDMYVRLHVCYYNKRGVLVSHPLYTAKNYLTHAFVLDLISVFPTSLVVRAAEDKDCKACIYLQLLHVLQIYRYFGLFNVLTGRVPLRPSLYVAKFFPLLVVACNVSSLFITNLDCEFHPRIGPSEYFSEGVICEPTSLFRLSNFEKPMSPLYVHYVGYYYSSSILTLSGMQGFTVQSLKDCCYTTFLGFIGVFIMYFIISNLVAVYSALSKSLLYYQMSLKRVKKFMKDFKVKARYRQEFIDHYELRWARKRGKDLNATISIFSRSLRQDLVWDVYGYVLERYSVFLLGCKAFFRQLLLETTHELMQGGCALAYVNCINPYLYIIYKGYIDIIAPDGMKLATIGRGGMCGNLDNYPLCRQTVALIPNGHVEIFRIEATKFHAILKKFPHLHKRFRKLTAMHIDYLAGRDNPVEEFNSGRNKSGRINNTLFNFLIKVKGHVYSPQTVGMALWKANYLFILCYLEFYIILYCLAMCEYNWLIVIQAYVTDAVFAIDFYLKFHTAYPDESGNLIRDLTKIKSRVTSDKFYIVFAIIIMIPIDLCIWFLPQGFPLEHRRLFGWLRCTKLLRIVFFIQYVHRNTSRLNIQLVFMRMFYFFCIALLSIHTSTCILIMISCIGKPNRIPPMLCFEIADFDASTYDKFQGQYLESFFVLLTCLVHFPQQIIYPVSGLLLITFSLIMHISTLVLGFVFAHIHNSLNMNFHFQLTYSNTVDRLKAYMEKHGVSIALVNRIWIYVRLLWRKHKGCPFPQLLEEAPPILKAKILNLIFLHHIANHPVFNRCHEDFVRQLVSHFRLVAFYDGDYILFKGDIDETMYFIQGGEVVVSVDDTAFKEDVVEVLRKGRSFGIRQGLKPLTPHVYSFRSRGESHVLMLVKSQWQYLLAFFPASQKSIFEALEMYSEY